MTIANKINNPKPRDKIIDWLANENQRRFTKSPMKKLIKLAQSDKAQKPSAATEKPMTEEGVKLGVVPGAGVYKRVP